MGFIFYKISMKRTTRLSKMQSISVGGGEKDKSVKPRVQNVKC
jgi:hypothetical protein